MVMNLLTYFSVSILAYWCLIGPVKSSINIDELEHAKNIIESIHNIFNNSYYRLFNDTDYDIMTEIQTIIYKMTLYDLPVYDLDHLEIAFINDLENKKKFIDLKISMHNTSLEINHRFNSLKSAISTYNHGKNKTYQHQQISLVCLNFETLSRQLYSLIQDTMFKESDNNFLQWVFTKIQHLRSNQCLLQMERPKLYFEFEMALSFLALNLKAFFIDTLCSKYLLNDDGSVNAKKTHLDSNTYSQLNRTVNAALKNYKSIRKYSHSAWRRQIENCDAPTFQRDVNFIELERVFQLIILTDTNSRGCCTNINGEIANSSCEGLISNCSDGPQIRYCTSQQQSRRYEWFRTFQHSIKPSKVNNHRLEVNFGNKNNCINEIKELSRIIDFHHGTTCEFCHCTCEETMHYSNKSTFIISSQWAESDFKKNFLITGVRFIKNDRIIYTQIMQGELKLGGRIGKSSWKEITPLNRNKINTEMQKLYQVRSDKTEQEYIVINSRLKHINLNDVQCPSSDNYVLTGIKLGSSKYKHNANRIVLFIRCHKIVSPSWSIDESSVTEPIEDDRPHPNLLVIGGLPPTMVQQVHHPYSTETMYVGFKMSDWRDAGQSVIPWFDAQNVTSPSGSIALSGVGIYHRGSKSSGGFLAYRLIAVEHTRHISPEIMKNRLVAEREKLDSSPAHNYCGHVLDNIMCMLCRSSYYPSQNHTNHQNTFQAAQLTSRRKKRGIVDECCTQPCTTFDLKQYCGSVLSDDGLDIVECRKSQGIAHLLT